MRLSDFKDEKGIEVVAKLLIPIGNIAANSKNAEARGKGNLAFASALLQNNQRDVMDMLAILNDKDPAEYHCTAASALVDVFSMISDPELLQLFGLQRQTLASSGSASATTEAPETSELSHDTAAQE